MDFRHLRIALCKLFREFPSPTSGGLGGGGLVGLSKVRASVVVGCRLWNHVQPKKNNLKTEAEEKDFICIFFIDLQPTEA